MIVQLLFIGCVLPLESVGYESISDLVESMLNSSAYNKKERPYKNQGKPVTIDVSVFISSISEISEITMDYSINMFLRQIWKDPRLAAANNSIFNQSETLSHELISKFWLPDLYLRNERKRGEFHDITVPNILLRLSPDGTVFFSQRISSVLTCQMHLQYYPLDKQTCEMQMESYGYSTKDEIFQWLNGDASLEVNDIVELPEFNITSSSYGSCTAVFSTGTYACIYARFTLQRLFQFYLIQVYVPSILIVVLSWVSFWIDINAVPARISLGLLTVLTITTQTSGISAKLPRVSYIKAIDVWMFTNTVFVFGALIEYSIVNVLARTHKNKMEAIKKKNVENQKESKYADENQVHLNEKTEPKQADVNEVSAKSNHEPLHINVPNENRMSWCQHVKFNRAYLVDVISRVMFPGSYILFNILYWTFYLIL